MGAYAKFVAYHKIRTMHEIHGIHVRGYRALMFSWPYAGMAGIQCTQIVKAAQAAMTEMDWHDVALTP